MAPAAISAQPSPRRHLYASISMQASPAVQACPCRHLHAGTSMQASLCRHFRSCRLLRASTSTQAPPCRHLRAGISGRASTSMQAPPRKHLRAGTSMQAPIRRFTTKQDQEANNVIRCANPVNITPPPPMKLNFLVLQNVFNTPRTPDMQS